MQKSPDQSEEHSAMHHVCTLEEVAQQLHSHVLLSVWVRYSERPP